MGKKAQKRAQAEQFSYNVDVPGQVDVTNDLMACTCPHHVHPNALCKHMAAVESATDDATLEAFPSEDDNDTEPEDCEGLSDFPCWPCVQTGRKELPNYPPYRAFI